MTCEVGFDETGIVVGDSLVNGFGASTTPMPAVLGPELLSNFGAPVVPNAANGYRDSAVHKWPTWTIEAASGRSTAHIGPTMPTVLLPYNPTDFAFIFLGVNDASNVHNGTSVSGEVQTLSTVTTHAAQVADGLNTWGVPYAKMLWWLAWAHGTGDIDTEIVQVNAIIAALAAARGFTTVNPHGVVPNTIPTYSVDGVHPNDTSGLLIAQLGIAAMTFTTT